MRLRFPGLPALGVIVVVLLVGGVLAGVAIADDTGDDVFYACEKGGNIISGSVSVNQERDCPGGSNLVSWHSGVPQPEFESCVGTYFVHRAITSPTNEVFLSDAFWTFSADGTFQGTTSSERTDLENLGFSHKQGAWEATADFVANMVNLDFEFDFPGGLVARNDSVVSFGSDCTEFTAQFAFRVYDLTNSEDPLEPSQGTEASGPSTATGRLLTTP
jgi:hypothetical protein